MDSIGLTDSQFLLIIANTPACAWLYQDHAVQRIKSIAARLDRIDREEQATSAKARLARDTTVTRQFNFTPREAP